jgi:hypothetical protein
MADKIIGSLLNDDHPPPNRARDLKDRLKVPVAIALVLLFISGVLYKFANFREERRVKQFAEEVMNGRYEAAYGEWDATPRYKIEDFLEDWGKDGYYTKGMHQARVIDSNSEGRGVIVYLAIDTLEYPVPLLVNKETRKISFSPKSKYPMP